MVPILLRSQFPSYFPLHHSNRFPPSTGSFKTSYSATHQELFLDQVYASATSGFLPGQLGSDSSFPRCLQCAAIDRARLATKPPTARSDFCSTCFKQYCFDAANPPSDKDLPGRKFKFVDPTPSALSKAEAFFKKHGLQLAIGLGVAVVLSIIGCAAV